MTITDKNQDNLGINQETERLNAMPTLKLNSNKVPALS